MHDLPTYDDMITAVARIAGHANRTPIMSSRTLDEELGTEAFFRRKNSQRTGAFKFRDAFNALSRFSAEQRAAGVVAFPSGSHAQAIALSTRLLGILAIIVMPADVPAVKIETTRGYGGQIVLYNRYTEGREQVGHDLAQRHGLTLISPYDHPDVLAGQGTAAKELFEEAGPLDTSFVPLGDGGLLSGCALAIRALTSACRIYGVEPEAGNDGQRSLRSDIIVHIDTPQTLADGARTQHLGDLTFPLIQRNVGGILTAGDAGLVDGMHFLTARMKLLVEPTGYLGLAAAHQRKDELCGKRVGILLNGGNVDLIRLCVLFGG